MSDPRHLGPQFRWKTDENPKGHTYIDDEAIDIDEIHKNVGFVERDPAYLLEKHKAKKAK